MLGMTNFVLRLTLEGGIFQGDSLSPLLFSLPISPLSTLLGQTEGYHCEYLGEPLTHIFFMDDLKIYGKNSAWLDKLLALVQEGSAAVGMVLGL